MASISYDINSQRRSNEDVRVIHLPGRRKQMQKQTPERIVAEALKVQLQTLEMPKVFRENTANVLLDMPQLPNMNAQILAGAVYILYRAGYTDFHHIVNQNLTDIIHPQVFVREADALIEHILIPNAPENIIKKIRNPTKKDEIIIKFKVNLLSYIESIFNYMSE